MKLNDDDADVDDVLLSRSKLVLVCECLIEIGYNYFLCAPVMKTREEREIWTTLSTLLYPNMII